MTDRRKRLAIIIAALALILGLAVYAIASSLADPGVSLTFLEFRRWPHGAMLRLTNSSSRTVTCFARRDDIPRGSPCFRLEKTPNGWPVSTVSVTNITVFSGASFSPSGRQLVLQPSAGRQVYFLVDPAKPTPSGLSTEPLASYELNPGQSMDFFVSLPLGAPPRRFGTACVVSPGTIEQKLRPLLNRVRAWLGKKPADVRFAEVWCPDALSFKAAGEPVKDK